MDRTIYKYPLTVADRQEIRMPDGAQILCVQVQRGMPCVWALVDPAAPQARKAIYIYGTGHAIPADPGRYIGTFQVQGGDLVFHVFEHA